MERVYFVGENIHYFCGSVAVRRNIIREYCIAYKGMPNMKVQSADFCSRNMPMQVIFEKFHMQHKYYI